MVDDLCAQTLELIITSYGKVSHLCHSHMLIRRITEVFTLVFSNHASTKHFLIVQDDSVAFPCIKVTHPEQQLLERDLRHPVCENECHVDQLTVK